MNQEITRQTQLSFLKLIRKPQLTEKLLSRPPFKFIHDIVTEVSKSASIMQGLFSEEELNADNLKDKEGRMKYLFKLIEFVSLTTNLKIDVKPSKIVAGLEADKTNFLLQKLAQVAKKKSYNDLEVVNQVLIAFKEKPIENKKLETKKPPMDPPKPAVQPPPEEVVQKRPSVRPSSARGEKQRIVPSPAENAEKQDRPPEKVETNGTASPPVEKPPTDQPESPRRPSTSRRGPPKVAEKPPKGATIPPVAQPEENSTDEDFLVQEKNVTTEKRADDLVEQGALVMKLLKSKEQFAEGDAAPRKHHMANEKDIREAKSLRESVQRMTCEVNQLAMIFDVSQQHEDLVLMMRELEKWREEEEQLNLSISTLDESNYQSAELFHLEGLVESLNEEIAGLEREIERSKGHIAQNNSKIDFTLTSLANRNYQ